MQKVFRTANMISLYKSLIEEFGDRLTPQIQRKATLTVLSHALEDAIIQNNLSPVIFAAFQEARYFQIERARYDMIGQTARAVVVYGRGLEMSPHSLEQDWFVIINEPRFKAMLVSAQLENSDNSDLPAIYKPYHLVWSYDAQIVDRACVLLVEQTLAKDSAAKAALNLVLAQPHHLSEQAQLVEQVGERIVTALELTNLRLLKHIVRNQQLLGELEQQHSQLSQLNREREMMAGQQSKILTELKQLYAEFNRTQHLMTVTFVERARLEQQLAQSSALLEKLRLVVSSWEHKTLPPTELERVAALLDQLTNLHEVR